MIIINKNQKHQKVRDYRTAARQIKKNKSSANVEWYDEIGEITFAVAFENGKRMSSCFLKEQ